MIDPSAGLRGVAFPVCKSPWTSSSKIEPGSPFWGAGGGSLAVLARLDPGLGAVVSIALKPRCEQPTAEGGRLGLEIAIFEEGQHHRGSPGYSHSGKCFPEILAQFLLCSIQKWGKPTVVLTRRSTSISSWVSCSQSIHSQNFRYYPF